jgi:Type I phosphodiesterase / nucleotide pyrophosphatase
MSLRFFALSPLLKSGYERLVDPMRLKRGTRLIISRTVLATLLLVGCNQRQKPPNPEATASAAVLPAVSTSQTATTNTASSPRVPDASPTLAANATHSPALLQLGSAQKAAVKHVVLLSVDGLAPRFLEMLIEQGKAPHFAALQKQAAWTHNARTDKTYTITLPNHTSMVTGLPVSPTKKHGPHFAHGWTENIDPMPSDNLHRYRVPAGSYTASMFDVAHDHGLRTAMFASKTKFSLYAQTYNDAGAADAIGPDNGRQKIDTVVIDVTPSSMVDSFIAQLQSNPPALSFVHLNQPDGAGHGVGWGSPAYLAAVQQMDALLGKIVAALQSPKFADNAALIVTADHGGVEMHHGDQSDMRNFQIPFYLWAPGVAPGDAYRVFGNRFAPGNDNPSYDDEKQPLRNGDAGNLAVGLLGLGTIPGSVIHGAGLQRE